MVDVASVAKDWKIWVESASAWATVAVDVTVTWVSPTSDTRVTMAWAPEPTV